MVLTARNYFSPERSNISAKAEADFYDSLKMRNNTFKRTSASRLSEVETVFAPLLRERTATIREALDIGVSTGTTTLELAKFLRSLGATTHVTATDLFVQAHIVETWPGIRVLADASGWPLQFEIFNLPVRAWTRKLDYLTLMAIPGAILRKMLRRKTQAMIATGNTTPVRMVNREIENRTDITVVENNILEHSSAFEGRFDFVRAANILNSNYFPDSDLSKAVANIKSYLRGPGSLVLITRTNRALVNAGTLFELQGDGRLQVKARLGAGSELEDLALSHAN